MELVWFVSGGLGSIFHQGSETDACGVHISNTAVTIVSKRVPWGFSAWSRWECSDWVYAWYERAKSGNSYHPHGLLCQILWGTGFKYKKENCIIYPLRYHEKGSILEFMELADSRGSRGPSMLPPNPVLPDPYMLVRHEDQLRRWGPCLESTPPGVLGRQTPFPASAALTSRILNKRKQSGSWSSVTSDSLHALPTSPDDEDFQPYIRPYIFVACKSPISFSFWKSGRMSSGIIDTWGVRTRTVSLKQIWAFPAVLAATARMTAWEDNRDGVYLHALIIPVFAHFAQASKGGTTKCSTTHSVDSFQNIVIVVVRMLNSNTRSQEVSDQCLSLETLLRRRGKRIDSQGTIAWK